MAKQTFTTGQVLTAAQMTSLQQTAMLGGAASAKTASYTLVAADAGTAISMSSASATTITVNTALFAAGDTVQITNLGVGVCTITAGTATVNTSATLALARYESGTLDFTSTSAAIFIKGAGAAAASGGITLITETVASSNSSIDFSSISGSYKQLLLVWCGIYHTAGSTLFGVRLNSDTGSNYMNLGIGFNDGTAADQRGTDTYIQSSGAGRPPFGDGVTSTDLGNTVRGQLLIDNYSSSTKLKPISGQWSSQKAGVGSRTVYYLGTYNSASAITAINIFRISGAGDMTNIANTSIRLYGIV